MMSLVPSAQSYTMSNKCEAKVFQMNLYEGLGCSPTVDSIYIDSVIIIDIFLKLPHIFYNIS